MKLIIVAFMLLCSFALQAQHQKHKPVSLYLGLQYTSTIRDATEPSNPWAFGAFLTAYGNTGRVRPVIDLAGDLFLMSDKVGRYFGGEEQGLREMWSVMAGASVTPVKWLNIGVVTGPAMLNQNPLWAFKPLLDITHGKGGVTIRFNYLQTGKRVKLSSVNHYSAFSLGVGFRLIGKPKDNSRKI